MTDPLDERIRSAVRDIANSAPDPSPQVNEMPLRPAVDPRSRRVPMVATAAAVVVLVVGATIGLRIAADDEVTVAAPASNPPSSVPVPSAVPAPGVHPIDVANAIAPFDHDSHVDSTLLEMWFSQQQIGEYARCLRDDGFADRAPDVPDVLPDRDDPMLASHWQFPDVELLAREGFAFLPGRSWEEDHDVFREGFDEAAARCGELIDHELEELAVRLGEARGSWEQHLATTERDPAVVAADERFTHCLGEAGVEDPPDLETYPMYLDALIQEAPEEQWAGIHRDQGVLYAECGVDLFQVREQVRTGEGRSSFLLEHEGLIEELSSLMASEAPDR